MEMKTTKIDMEFNLISKNIFFENFENIFISIGLKN